MPYASWTKTASIAIGGTISNAIYLAGNTLVGIQMPSAWTTASITFAVSPDGVTYSNMYDNLGNELAITASKSTYIYLNPDNWFGVNYLQIRSGTSGSPVAQTPSAAVVTLVSKGIAQ